VIILEFGYVVVIITEINLLMQCCDAAAALPHFTYFFYILEYE